MTGLGGDPFSARQGSYSADGDTVLSDTAFRPGGARTVDVESPGQTFQAVKSDTYLDQGAPDETFVFGPGHGHDVIAQFRALGADHDVVSLLGSDFGNSLATVLRDTRDTAGGAVITDPTTGDTVRLAGLGEARLVHNPSDIALHG